MNSNEGLAENYYICLDIYKKYLHTKVRNCRDAWLTFLSSTSIQDILELCHSCPEFIPIYEEIFQYQKNVEEMVDMFSEALAIMNHNTELYMIEELRMELDAQANELENKDKKLASQANELASQANELKSKDKKLFEAKEREFSNVKKVMDSFNKTADEAMDFLQINPDDRQTILDRLNLPSKEP